jgi:hypothetical protein
LKELPKEETGKSDDATPTDPRWDALKNINPN